MTESTPADHLQTLLRWGVYATVLVPLVYSKAFLFPYTTTKAYVIMGLVDLLVLGVIWLMWLRPDIRPVRTSVGIALSVFVTILLVTSFFGVDPSFSFWASVDRITGGLMWLHLLGFFWVVTTLFRSREQWIRLFAVSVSVALVTAAVHLFTLMGIEAIGAQRGGSTFGNSSFFGTYLLFQIGFAAYLGLRAKGRLRTYGIVSGAILAVTLLLTTANAAKISLVGGVILCAALLLMAGGKTSGRRKAGWGLFLALALGFLATVALAFQEGSVVYTWFTDIATGSRFVVWDMAWQAFLTRPLFGWGLENFQLVSLEFYNPCLGSEYCGHELWFDRAHNKILDLLVEAGIVGLVSYVGIFVVAIRSLVKERVAELAVLGSVLAAYVVQNLTILDMSSGLLMFVLTLAFAASAGSKAFTRTPKAHKGKQIPVLVPLAASVATVFALIFFVVQPAQGNMAVGRTVLATTLEDRSVAYERAVTLSPIGIDFRRVYLVNQTAKVMWDVPVESVPQIETFLREELALIEEVIGETLEESPNYLRGQLELAYALQGASRKLDPEMLDRAEDLLVEAVENNPLQPQAHWALASIYLDQGRVDEAVALTQHIVTVSPDVPRAHIFHMMALLFTGDREALEAAAEQTLLLDPKSEADVLTLLAADLEQQRERLLVLLHF